MRVALVNALSYPSFVSGATVQVHRIARALDGQGHQVAVFSGGRRPGTKAYSTRQEQVEGITITSINTEDFLDFSDRLNFDNPGAVAPLLAWLADYEPDVVHAHSLQGLGAAWIDAAAADCPVVVTMHDWWWICARQFLVTEEMQIDAPLADVDGCQCSGGLAFNQDRRAWLTERLARVQRVLVPSAFMRDSLLLHGFAPDKVTVDPNGIEQSAPTTEGGLNAGAADDSGHRGPADGPPHLGFVGGWHDFKGLPLLMEARRLLPDEPLPMRLTCWGAARSVETRRLPAGVRVEPDYAPEDTASVMRSLDALAVPSLMRESFSIVVREALLNGVPVICSDSGGPEEVVRHGENGLVVESGSPAAWAAALARWCGDRDLRDQLRLGAARGPARVVDPETQAAHLERVYNEVQVRVASVHRPTESPMPAHASARPAATPPDLLIVSGIEGAPLRYRAHQLAATHRAMGGEAQVLHHRHQGIPEAISHGGLVLFYRVPWSSWTRTCMEIVRDRGAAAVFSVDDLIFSPELRDRIPAVRALPPTEAEQWMEGVHRYQATAHACGIVLASTPAIAQAAKGQGMAGLIQPNGLSREIALLSQEARWSSRDDRARRRQEGTCRIGYLSGTTTHDADWALVEPAISKILEEDPAVELWLLGLVREGGALAGHSRVRRIGFRPYQELPRLQAELDIVLAPLEPELEFSEAKSAVKWLEAAALGIPVVASPTDPFRAVVEDGITGMLAGPMDWHERVSRLISNPDMRDCIGHAARAEVYRSHGPSAMVAAWAQTWPLLAELARTAAPARLPDATFEERPSVLVLEPEAPDGYLDQQASGIERTSSRLGGSATHTAVLHSIYPRLCRVDIQTTTFGALTTAPVRLSLTDGSRTLLEGQLAEKEVADDGWTAWRFDPIEASSGRALTITIAQPEAPPGKGIACWTGIDNAVCLRSWARPSRAEICAVAIGRPLVAVSSGGKTASPALVLWHRGRHSLASQGIRATMHRVMRYAQRWWRGHVASRRAG